MNITKKDFEKMREVKDEIMIFSLLCTDLLTAPAERKKVEAAVPRVKKLFKGLAKARAKQKKLAKKMLGKNFLKELTEVKHG